jgi:hypothetical protein
MFERGFGGLHASAIVAQGCYCIMRWAICDGLRVLLHCLWT